MKRVASVGAWWIVLYWLWLAFVGEWNGLEWGAAAVAATVATAIAEVVRRQPLLRPAFRARWLLDAANLPLQILEDCLIVLAALPRRRHGIFHARPTGPSGDSAEAAGRAAFLTIAASYSPNALVLDVDRESGTVLLHDLVPRRGSERPA